MKFKIGDRIKMIKDCDHAYEGMIGTIKKVTDHMLQYAVEFDNEFDGAHYCGGICDAKRGHWIGEDYMTLMKSYKIVIESDEKTTTAKLFEDGKKVKTAKARCSDEDEFNFFTGAELVLERVLAPRFKVGDIVIGNDKADDNYIITVKGWRGIVTECDKNTFNADGLVDDGEIESFERLKYSCFDLN